MSVQHKRSSHAPWIGDRRLTIAGQEMALRPSPGLPAQPFSVIGLPVVPVFAAPLPLGVRIVAPP